MSQKVLFLAVAWVHEDDKRLFELYPEVIMCDVTEGTNTEKGNCMHYCAKTGTENILLFSNASCLHSRSGVFNGYLRLHFLSY